ncbi:hypothetical protein SAMN05421858_0322 [Haladaptatus litoreus]|uniref:Uncharacterized protein n=1 Tax=Haladaptatus litoreus TaxID=553468 RepID=A0A1N6VEA8_9EURY|nr:hypothetical protein SAMN05421858_0322 [Haladaptatus litoreus]
MARQSEALAVDDRVNKRMGVKEGIGWGGCDGRDFKEISITSGETASAVAVQRRFGWSRQLLPVIKSQKVVSGCRL